MMQTRAEDHTGCIGTVSVTQAFQLHDMGLVSVRGYETDRFDGQDMGRVREGGQTS